MRLAEAEATHRGGAGAGAARPGPPEPPPPDAPYLATAPAGPGDRWAAIAVASLSVLVLAVVAPIAAEPWAPVPAFIPAYQAVVAVNDLVTAALLFGQFRELRRPSLLLLGGGYLLTACLVVAHGLSFPGLFGPGSLLGGAQTTVWLWLAWHTAFPLAVLGYASLVGGRRDAAPPPGARGAARMGAAAVLAPLALAGGCALLAAAGHDRLPALLDGDGYVPGVTRPVLAVPFAAALLALAALAARTRLRRALDLWLGVALGAWAVEILLSALLNSGRFQAGFYVGRLYGLVASCTVLVSLLLTAAALHGRLARALARERGAADVALAASEARFRAMADNVPQLAWMARPDGWIFWYNKRWFDYTGATLAEMEGWGWRAVHHPDHVERVAVRFRRSIEAGEPWEDTFPLRGKDGEWRWFLSRALPVRDEEGRIALWFGTNTDVTGSREVEAALRESEERLRLFIERAPAAIAMFDADMRYLAASRRFLLDYGLPVGDPGALAGRGHYEFFPDVPERWREVHRRVLAGEVLSAADDPFPRSDGRTDWIRWEMAPWHRADGSVGGALLFSEVVTARVEAERALAESEARFRGTFEQAAVGMAHVGLDGAWLRVNGRLCAMLGHTEAELLALTFQDVTHPDDLAADLENVRRLLAGEVETYTMEKRYLRRGGAAFWVELTVALARNAAGAPERFISVVQDIDARKRAEAALRRALAERGAVYASAPVALSLHDRDLRFRAVNGRMAAINGLPAGAHIGRTPGEAVPAIAEAVEPLMRRVLEAGEPIDGVEVETETAAHPGEKRHYLAAYHPVREEGGDGGAVDGVSVAVLDITGRKRAEAALRDLAATLEERVEERTRRLAEVAAELDAFAYTVSHDLRAPLRAMEGFARILEEDHGEALDAAGRRHARRIVEAAERLDGLIQDLLAYSRLSRADIATRPVPLEEAVDRALSDLPAGAAEVSVERPLPAVLGARPVLNAMLGNLLSNAVKFAEAGRRPRVRVRAEARPGARVRLWVEDDGIGIAPEHLGRIFLVFERLHGQEHYPGTGIGLAIVRKGAERLGGAAGAESDGPGRGSRFWIDLPATAGE